MNSAGFKNLITCSNVINYICLEPVAYKKNNIGHLATSVFLVGNDLGLVKLKIIRSQTCPSCGVENEVFKRQPLLSYYT